MVTQLESEIFPASYKGAFFFVTATSTSGGRKTSKKEIVDSDLQVIEDLGLSNRIFTLEGIISDKSDTSYKEMRDTLLRALESRGKGDLVHPFFGTVENLVTIDFKLTESFDRLGIASISMTFEISNTDGRPTTQKASLAVLEQNAKDGLAASQTDLADNFGVDPANASGNFEDATDKVGKAVDFMNKATDSFAIVAEKVDEYTQLIAETSEKITTLVDNPVQLADSITSIYLSVNGLYASTLATYNVLVSLFDFGDDDIALVFPNTAQSRERQNNRDVLNNAMKAMALILAYLNAAQLEFQTTDDLSTVQNQLEEQYQKLFVSTTLPSEVLEALTVQRSNVQEFFEGIEPNLRSVVTVRTNPISARLLSHQYYGNSELGQDIVDLNNALEPVFLEGDVSIFSLTTTTT